MATKNIIVKQVGETYQAHLEDNTKIWGAGKTPERAIFNLIDAHSEIFGIKIKAEKANQQE